LLVLGIKKEVRRRNETISLLEHLIEIPRSTLGITSLDCNFAQFCDLVRNILGLELSI